MDHADISEGFYRSDCWPYYFTVTRCTGMEGLFLWGFSIWKNQPGYRTFGSLVSLWLSQHPTAIIERDHDRIADKQFLREYRSKQKAAKLSAAEKDKPCARAERDRLKAELDAVKAKLAALVEVATALREVAFDGPSQRKSVRRSPREADEPESLWEWKERVDRESAAAIAAAPRRSARS